MKGEADKTAEENEVKENKEQKQVEQSVGASTANPNRDKPASPRSSGSGRRRQPFTQLSQIESDMALAQALQEQERAYLILRTGGYNYDHGGYNVGDESEEGEDVESDHSEVPAGDADALENRDGIDGSQYENDEAFARALQEAEDRETTARMMALAGIHDLEEAEEGEEGEDEEEDDDDDDDEDHDNDDDEEDEDDDASEDMWQDVDPDNMSYEELIALGEVVGTQSKGLAPNTIAELPVSSYKCAHGGSSSDSEQCVICRHEYEEEDSLLTLPCKHNYHSECIQQWLQINKVCPVCSAEVGAAQGSS